MEYGMNSMNYESSNKLLEMIKRMMMNTLCDDVWMDF